MSVTGGKPETRRFYYGWIIVAGAWLMYMLNQAAFTWGFTVFVQPLGAEFGWSRTAIAFAWAMSLSWGLLLGPLFGACFDRYGTRAVMAIAESESPAGAAWSVTNVPRPWWVSSRPSASNRA